MHILHALRSLASLRLKRSSVIVKEYKHSMRFVSFRFHSGVPCSPNSTCDLSAADFEALVLRFKWDLNQ